MDEKTNRYVVYILAVLFAISATLAVAWGIDNTKLKRDNAEQARTIAIASYRGTQVDTIIRSTTGTLAAISDHQRRALVLIDALIRIEQTNSGVTDETDK